MTSRICAAKLRKYRKPAKERRRVRAHLLLERSEIFGGEGVGLGDDGDEVDAGSETLHDLNVERLEAVERVRRVERQLANSRKSEEAGSRVSGRPDEIQASVYTHVELLSALRLLLLAHERLVLIVLVAKGQISSASANAPRPQNTTHDEVDDGSPAVPVVHVVSESGRVDDGELDLELLLLELGLDDVCSEWKKKVSYVYRTLPRQRRQAVPISVVLSICLTKRRE